MEEQVVGLVMNSVMIQITMRPVTMTMVIVADFPQGKTFVLIVFVKVNSFDLQKEICSIITFF